MNNYSDFSTFPTIQLENHRLPNGSIYTGEAKNISGELILIQGNGRAINPDGSNFEGEWKYGRPYGYGKHTFADGDFHIGFFDDKPNGPGCLILNTIDAMNAGFFLDGEMNGWAIALTPDGGFDCSYVEDGYILENHTDDFRWMNRILFTSVFDTYTRIGTYKGGVIQSSAKNGHVRFGAPNRIVTKRCGEKYQRHAIGYLFSTDGNLYIGLIKDHKNLNGYCVVCTPDHRIISGKWENNVLVEELSLLDVEMRTEELLELEQYSNIITEAPTLKSDDYLPF